MLGRSLAPHAVDLLGHAGIGQAAYHRHGSQSGQQQRQHEFRAQRHSQSHQIIAKRTVIIPEGSGCAKKITPL
jgi:hypothetical protein